MPKAKVKSDPSSLESQLKDLILQACGEFHNLPDATIRDDYTVLRCQGGKLVLEDAYDEEVVLYKVPQELNRSQLVFVADHLDALHQECRKQRDLLNKELHTSKGKVLRFLEVREAVKGTIHE